MISVEHLSNFGGALQDLRWKARMKQIEVCRATGMTAPQVSRYENGHEMPTVESLVKYLSAVDADLCDLQSILVALHAVDEVMSSGDEEAVRAGPPAPRRVRLADERRLESSSGMRQMVGGMMKLNLESMEMLEHRMKSMEEWMEDMKRAGEEKQRARRED